MVARNSEGVCLWWQLKQLMGRPSPVDGEAMTILNALELAKAKGWSNIVME